MQSVAPFVQLSKNGKYFVTKDGQPFFWLSDTWWYGLTDRTSQDVFEKLVKQRAAQGFTVVMMVVGVPPEVPLDSLEAKSDGHFPFTENFSPNPNYFEAIEKKITVMVHHGIVPCLVGGWGPQIQKVGVQKFTRFWDEMLTSFSRYPVQWCLTGEVDLTTLSPQQPGLLKQTISLLPDSLKNILRAVKHKIVSKSTPTSTVNTQVKDWLKVAEHIVNADKTGRVLLVHPHTQQPVSQILGNPRWLKVDSIQSGHSTDSRLFLSSQAVAQSRQSAFINLEPLYEGILGNDDPEFQRYAFWMSILGSAKGHTYGADGLWNMRDGDSFLGHWGDTSWKEAVERPGAEQLGKAKKWLESVVEWWTLSPAIESITPHWESSEEKVFSPLCAKTTNDDHLCYFPLSRPTQQYNWLPGKWMIQLFNPSTMELITTLSGAQTFLDLSSYPHDVLLFAKKQ